MKNNYPTLKCFTKRNLFRMLQFYKAYKDNEKVTPLVTQLSWTNNLLILSNCKTEEEREFYLNLSIKETQKFCFFVNRLFVQMYDKLYILKAHREDVRLFI